MRFGILLGWVWALGVVGAVRAQEHEHEEQRVVVVFVGEAGGSEALRSVIEELLGRQGVSVQLEAHARFEPEVWLDAGVEDDRAYAFVVVPDAKKAQLYFRGPRGERFLLRELALRAGLDEVGRELIAGVVETSTVTLLRSTQGVSKEEARAELAKAAPVEPAPPPVVKPKPALKTPRAPPQQRTLYFMFGAHVSVQATGEHIAPRIAGGLDLGLVIALPGWPRLRPRMALAGGGQVLDAGGAHADVVTVSARGGLDVELVRGLYAGVSMGLDQVHVAPSGVSDDALRVSHATTERMPASRAELRYELALSETLRVGLGALIDVPWKATHYDVIREGQKHRAASSFAVQPGAIATFGAAL